MIVFTIVVLPILWTRPGLPGRAAARPAQHRALRDYTLDNFQKVLTSPGFVDALVTTLVYSISGTACAIGLGLVAALALRQPFRGRGSCGPHAQPVRRAVVAAAFIWSTMLNPSRPRQPLRHQCWAGTSRSPS